MRAELYFISDCPVGRLAIMPRPRAGDWLDGEAESWRRQGLDIVVSLLDDDEITELGLGDEDKACERAGLRFVRFPVADRGVPAATTAVNELVLALVGDLRAGRAVGIHCRMGIGRSSCLATCLLLAIGLALDQAWASVERSRGLLVPDTTEQREWVQSWLAQFKAVR